MILPGATLGVLGGGQLGAMFAMAAKRMGYRVEAISDVADCPAAHQCHRVHVGAYDDAEWLAQIARGLDVVTFEFENIPVAATRALERVVPVRPAPEVLFTTQNRTREKAFLVANGFDCVPHRVVGSGLELRAAVAALGLPSVLKTAAFGYDGKGQQLLQQGADTGAIDAAWETLGPQELLLEAWVDFEVEISVVAARGWNGETAVFEPSRNVHRHHILDMASTPAELPAAILATARTTTAAILEALGVVGVACVEFFVTRDGRVLVNEIAPRPHNSGHLTIDACETSQFEQQVRAICGLPLGSVRQILPAAMANLLGDCWHNGTPDWPAALAVPGVSLLLYGKNDPRAGRKMGHLTACAKTVSEAIENASRARKNACRF
ncbi:MAG: 5-(carboxyamino)imidazole ribonucleotide synthase [Planctomycetota bacterium]|nr:MAG: 5-(carboxyamino)imidazole ribonucleotide synthase [Planctomycetota bacterium]